MNSNQLELTLCFSLQIANIDGINCLSLLGCVKARVTQGPESRKSNQDQGRVELEPIPAAIRGEAGYTLDELPVLQWTRGAKIYPKIQSSFRYMY